METPLTTFDIGQYELFLFIAGFINFFWVNALVRGMLGHIDTTNTQEANRQVAQVFYIFGFLALVFGSLFLVGQYLFGFFGSSGFVLIAGASLYSLFWTPSMLLEYSFILRNQHIPMYLSGFVTPLFFVLFCVAGAVITQSVNGVILGTVVFAALRFFTTAHFVFQLGMPRIDIQWIKRFLLFSVPLLLSAVIAESGVYVDGIIVNALFDEQTFAIFRYGARELPLNSILALGLSNAMIPMFIASNNPEIELAELKSKTRRLIMILVPLSIIFLIFSDWLFIHVFNEAFGQSAIVFDVYLLLVLPRLLLPQTIIVGFRKNGLLVWVSIMEIISNVVLSVWWGIQWGIFGIALATLFSFMVEKAAMIYLTNKHLHIPPGKYIPIKTFLVLTIAIVFVFILKYV